MPVGRSHSHTHMLGAAAEDKALAYLQAQGLVLLAQNWHVARVGELDLVMREGNTLVFVEVRQRGYAAFGGALASITPAKQAKIIRTAQHFLAKYEQYTNHDCRFDVIAFENSQLQWLKAAFMAY